MDTKNDSNSNLDRRTFLRSTAAIGAGLFIAPAAFGAGAAAKAIGAGLFIAPGAFGAGAAAKKPDPLNVGIIGLGEQCMRLMGDAILNTRMDKTENIRFKAVCDIWPWRLKYRQRVLKAYKHEASAYESYKKMLAEEKDLDAVIVATPDWMHAPISIACMKAGLHVYCEKEMSNSLESAKKMVETSQATKKLLQIGHQRRSNPRYHAAKALVDKHRLLGKIKNVNGQWNRCVASAKVPVPTNKKIWMDEAALKKYEYGSMDELINWRWYEKFGGGPLGDLGSHQIDIFSWFLGDINPKSVLAVGGKDYFKMQHDEDVMAVYEYEGNGGVVREFYQVLNTSGYGSYGTYFENFMGDHGTLLISERAGEKNNGWAFLEDYVMTDAKIKANWDARVKDGLLRKMYVMPDEVKEQSILIVGGSRPLHSYPLATKLEGAVHAPHLKNFFDAIRDSKIKLNCPGEEGYRTAVAVLKANDAIKGDGKITFKKSDFEV